MIALKETPEPEFFGSQRITDILNNARAAIASGGKLELPGIWSEDEHARKAQHDRHHNGKCCYCERKRDIKLERDVEHYRPKLEVSEDPNHKGYWWLAYDWENLLISCKTCNTIYKKNHFPLRDENGRARAEGDNIDVEDALLINPAIEDPEQYFLYITEKRGVEYLTKIVSSDENIERGQTTIEILKLNRPELLGQEERSESYRRIKDTIENYIFWKRFHDHTVVCGDNEKKDLSLREIEKIKDCIKEEVKPTKTYSGFRRYIVRSSEQDELVELLNEI